MGRSEEEFDAVEFFFGEDILFHDFRGDVDRMRRYLHSNSLRADNTSRFLQNLPNRKGAFRNFAEKFPSSDLFEVLSLSLSLSLSLLFKRFFVFIPKSVAIKRFETPLSLRQHHGGLLMLIAKDYLASRTLAIHPELKINHQAPVIRSIKRIVLGKASFRRPNISSYSFDDCECVFRMISF